MHSWLLDSFIVSGSDRRVINSYDLARSSQTSGPHCPGSSVQRERIAGPCLACRTNSSSPTRSSLDLGGAKTITLPVSTQSAVQKVTHVTNEGDPRRTALPKQSIENLLPRDGLFVRELTQRVGRVRDG